MRRTGPVEFSLILLFLLAGFALVAPEASAQTLWQDGVFILDGEPTDPEGVVRLLGQAGVDFASNGVNTTAPTSEVEFLAWIDQLLSLLQALGIDTPGEPGP
jgi:hypothetical protein